MLRAFDAFLAHLAKSKVKSAENLRSTAYVNKIHIMNEGAKNGKS